MNWLNIVPWAIVVIGAVAFVIMIRRDAVNTNAAQAAERVADAEKDTVHNVVELRERLRSGGKL